jgi:hypothetical protein
MADNRTGNNTVEEDRAIVVLDGTKLHGGRKSKPSIKSRGF